LGQGWTFDDLAENTAISQEVVLVFFQKSINLCSIEGMFIHHDPVLMQESTLQSMNLLAFQEQSAPVMQLISCWNAFLSVPGNLN
jgi:hypothetical protein